MKKGGQLPVTFHVVWEILPKRRKNECWKDRLITLLKGWDIYGSLYPHVWKNTSAIRWNKLLKGYWLKLDLLFLSPYYLFCVWLWISWLPKENLVLVYAFVLLWKLVINKTNTDIKCDAYLRMICQVFYICFYQGGLLGFLRVCIIAN